LGRGLDALLSPVDKPADSEAATATAQTSLGTVPVGEIVRGRYQPRRAFARESLEELAASIRVQGVMQPVVLRQRAQGGYELVAGERRWRAAQIAGLERIPAVIKQVTDEQALAMALIENIQREDLNPLEEAGALDRLREEFNLTQQQIADAVGKSRVAVTNLLRLLNLAPAVSELLAGGAIEMGHARALLSLEPLEQERLAAEVAAKGLSVRQTEALVRRRLNTPTSGQPRRAQKSGKDADTLRLERDLSEKLGAPVSISHDPDGKGKLVIGYGSLDELEGILSHLRGNGGR
jgi:ParB family chromosome partitioning protein